MRALPDLLHVEGVVYTPGLYEVIRNQASIKPGQQRTHLVLRFSSKANASALTCQPEKDHRSVFRVNCESPAADVSSFDDFRGFNIAAYA